MGKPVRIHPHLRTGRDRRVSEAERANELVAGRQKVSPGSFFVRQVDGD